MQARFSSLSNLKKKILIIIWNIVYKFSIILFNLNVFFCDKENVFFFFFWSSTWRPKKTVMGTNGMIGTLNKKYFSYFYVQDKFLKLPDHDALWRLICRKVFKIGTWNFDTILINVMKLYYYNLGSISSIDKKLCVFPYRRNFVNYTHFSKKDLNKSRFCVLNFW